MCRNSLEQRIFIIEKGTSQTYFRDQNSKFGSATQTFQVEFEHGIGFLLKSLARMIYFSRGRNKRSEENTFLTYFWALKQMFGSIFTLLLLSGLTFLTSAHVVAKAKFSSFRKISYLKNLLLSRQNSKRLAPACANRG